MGVESSVNSGARSVDNDVIVIASSDEDFQRQQAPPARLKRSLALRTLDDGSINSEAKHEGDTKPATADKKRKPFPADGTLQCAPVVDLRPLLQQSKLRVRQPDGTYVWPHHLRMNIENIEAQRKLSSMPAYGDAEEKTAPTPACGDAEEKTAPTPACDDAEEKAPAAVCGDAEEETAPAAVCGDAEEETAPAAVCGDAEEEKTTTTEHAPVEKQSAADEVMAPVEKEENAGTEKKKDEEKTTAAKDKPSNTETPTGTTSNRLEASWARVESIVRPASKRVDGADPHELYDSDPSEDVASEYEMEEDSDDEEKVAKPPGPIYLPDSDFESDGEEVAAPARPGGADDSEFESDNGDGDDQHEGSAVMGRQIRVSASRAAATGGLSPAHWPRTVVHLREMFNPANIQLEYAYNFGLCSCESICRHPTCMNASLSLFCAPNCCQFGGHCGNALVESGSVAIATRGDSRGLALVATKAIDEGTILGQYLGEMVLESALETARPHTEGYRIMMFRRPVNARRQRVSIDARRYGSLMRFMNHSCAPVAKFAEACNGNQHTVIAVATQDISAGQEITVDYGADLWFQCECGEPSCRDREG